MFTTDEILTGKKRFRRVKRLFRKPIFSIEVEVHRVEKYFVPTPDSPDYGSTALIDSYYWRPLRVEDLDIAPPEVEIKGLLIC